MDMILFDSPIGPLGVAASEEHALTQLYLPGAGVPRIVCHETPLLAEAKRQLLAYLDGTLQSFDLPLAPHGTSFQQRVWTELCHIPYGQTISYGALASRMGSPRAVRAVGQANHRNPIPIIIPCHRVIGIRGALTGYAGGLELKQTLLNLEGVL